LGNRHLLATLVATLVGTWLLLGAPTAEARVRDAHVIALGGHGTTDAVVLRGRAHSGKPSSGAKGGGRLRKLASTAHAFVRNDLEHVRIEAVHLQSGRSHHFTTDGEGFFEGKVQGPLPAGAATFRLRVADPRYRSPSIDVTVSIVHASEPGLLVICDIDDTIADTGVTGGKLSLVQRVATSNADDMRAFPGAAATLTAFAQAGAPVIYLSAGPVELAPRTAEFLRRRGFPEGPLFLRRYADDGIGSPLAFKRAHVARLVGDYPARRLVLFGDNGEADVTLFRELVEAGRVAAAFVRSTLATSPDDPHLHGLYPFSTWPQVARQAGRLGLIRWLRAQGTARGVP
jgi:phosphatidate phosphatase APP1